MAARTIDELVRHCAVAHPTTAVISYPSTGSPINFTDYTGPQLDLAVSRAARHYLQLLPRVRRTSADPRIVVAVLGVTNMEYIVTYLALQRLGLTCLFLSTRLLEDAFVHLFQKTDCAVVLVQPEFKGIMESTRGRMEGQLEILPMVELATIETVTEQEETPLGVEFDPEAERGQVGWYIHSSGSTGLPKPVGHTHIGALTAAKCMVVPDEGGFITVPLFHTFGLYTLLHGLYTGIRTVFHSAEAPVTGPSVIAALNATGCGVLFTVPYVIKLIAETEGGTARIAQLETVVYGGAGCPQDLGDMLVREGVKLANHYGSTETGYLMRYAEEGWNWLRLVPMAEKYIKWEAEGEGLYQIIVQPGWPSLAASNREDGSYATKDLFERHPENPMVYRYVDRMDSTIVLSNGEKASPVLFEDALRDSRFVTEALVFGTGKPTLGVIIVKSEYADSMSREEFLASIAADIQRGNTKVPAYARIFHDAVIIKEADTDFPRTDKGNFIRAAFLRAMKNDIESYYARLEQEEAQSGKDLSADEIRQLVRTTIANSLQVDSSEVKDNTDFFTLGLDSLMAISVRRTLTKEVNTSGKVLSSNIVFEHPTVDALTSFLVGLRGGVEVQQRPVQEVMQGLIDKYSTFKQHVPKDVTVDGEYIVLTGATGSLGAHTLAILVRRLAVKQVYCFVRAATPSAGHERVISALKHARHFETLTEAQKSKIVALPADLSQETFGLPEEVYSTILHSVTNIIHVAWSVNFNMDVTSFEKHHIRGTWNLINLCLASPHRTPASFNLISSVSTMMALHTTDGQIPEIPSTFASVMPMGYGQSKMVAESMCLAAVASTPISARILRVGQIVGDTVHGVWNATEALPLTLQSAVTIGALPNGNAEHSWLPVDTTAGTIVDLALLDRLPPVTTAALPRDAVLHVCHPAVLRWKSDILPALREAGLEFEEVEQQEWISRLTKEQDPVKNPPIKLLEWFKAQYAEKSAEEEARGAPYFMTTEARKYSPTLRQARNVDAELVGKFLGYWKAECW